MPETPIPQTAPLVYRGDRYRLNFTAGTLLLLLAEYGDKTVTQLFDVLHSHNTDAGIPGGEAGTQWTPPAAKPIKSYKDTKLTVKGKPRQKVKVVDPDDHDQIGADPNGHDDVPDIEYYDDLIREHCTYFEDTESRVVSVLQQLDYARLVDFTGTDAAITELGRGVVEKMREAEANARVEADVSGKMTPTQAYLLGDSRDTVGTHKVPFDVLPFSVTDAVRLAKPFYGTEDVDPTPAFDKLTPGVFDDAVRQGVKAPGGTVDTGGNTTLDSEMPIRQSLHRQPTYRQFLWILARNKSTFVLAYTGVTPEATKLVQMKSDLGDAALVASDPVRQRMKKARAIARGASKFAQQVLTGGPEGVWVGKPLNPRDVHADVMSFIEAKRPGFNSPMALGSSMAWEAYDTLRLTIGDLERARVALNEGIGKGLISYADMPTTDDLDAEEFVADANDKLSRLQARQPSVISAANYVQRTSDKVLTDMGLDVEFDAVMAPSGVPMDIMCEHTEVFVNNRSGHEVSRRCNAHAIGGTGRCEKHGGTYLSPEETESLVRAAQQKIFAGVSKATEVMIEIMLTSPNDAVRLRAAEQIMNRGGLSESRDINVNVEHTVEKTAAERVREKVMQLVSVPPEKQAEIEQNRSAGVIDEYGDPTIVDGEVVDERP